MAERALMVFCEPLCGSLPPVAKDFDDAGVDGRISRLSAEQLTGLRVAGVAGRFPGGEPAQGRKGMCSETARPTSRPDDCDICRLETKKFRVTASGVTFVIVP